jgi:alpha-tubulin suppressor-like RCC1 family protein
MRTGAVLAFGGVVVAAGIVHAATPSIAAGYTHSVAVHADGTVRAWGDDRLGQLASGTTASAGGALQVTAMPTLKPGADSVAAGDETAFAIASDGTLWSWGKGLEGILGDGTTNDRSTPGRVTGLSNVIAVAASQAFAVALTADGNVWGWGNNAYGQIGGTSFSRSTPARINGIANVIAVAVGIAHTVALKSDGTVWSWGNNGYGQLPGVPGTATSTPTQIAGIAGVTRIAAGGFHTMALKSDGTVWEWGNAIRSVTQIPNITATRIAASGVSPSGYGTLSPGSTMSLALKPDGTVWSWTFGFGSTPSPAQEPYWSNVIDVRAGSGTRVALRSDGRVLVVGPPPGDVLQGVTGATSIAAGNSFALAGTSGGAAFTWGSDNHGQLGQSQPLNRSAPIVSNGLSGVTQLTAGNGFTAALRSDGTVWVWGNNMSNVRGTNGGSSSTPSLVPSLTNVTQIAAGQGHLVALRGDGTVWTWGDNPYGQLGRGFSTFDNVGPQPFEPQMVPALSGVAYIAAGDRSSFAVRGDGALWAWGSNELGQLGISIATTCAQPVGGPVSCAKSPVQVTGATGVVSLASAGGHTVAARSDGTVLAWGRNGNGELGDATTTSRTSPAPVPGLSGVQRVVAGAPDCLPACGGGFSAALKSDGTVVAWGSNDRGQLGDASPGTQQAVPHAVAGVTQAISIAAGDRHVVVVRRDGTVMAWGDNRYGQLGDGTFAVRSTAVFTLRENGAGSIAGNDWFLDLDSSVANAVDADRAPAFVAVTSGDPTANIISVTSDIRFRAQDIGKPIRIFAYAPAGLVKRAPGAKDGLAQCVLAQLGPSGLTQASAANLAAAGGNVANAQAQAVSVMNSVSSSQVAGTTFCVGTGTDGAQALAASNSVCVASVPPSNAGDPACAAPAGAGTTSPPSTSPSYQGLWWRTGGVESGWGLNITHQGDTLFATWFTYDTDGSGMWLVMSDGARNASGGYTGSLVRTTGPAFSATPWNGALVTRSIVGTATLSFTDTDNGTFAYTVNGVTQSKPITKLAFASPAPACSLGGDTSTTSNYQDLWWASPAGSESGWGLNIAHQGDVLFATWFTYDAGTKGMWLVMSDGAKTGNGTYAGTLQRTTGPAFSTGQWVASQVTRTTVGTASLTFSDANNGVFRYVVNGESQSKAITRLVYSSPPTVCR